MNRIYFMIFLAFDDLPDSKETFINKLRKLSFTSQQIDAAIQQVVSFDPWLLEGQAYHTKALAKEAHTTTWASFELLSTIIETTDGTLAGTSWADLAFCVIITRTLIACREALASEDLVYQCSMKQLHLIEKVFGPSICPPATTSLQEVSFHSV